VIAQPPEGREESGLDNIILKRKRGKGPSFDHLLGGRKMKVCKEEGGIRSLLSLTRRKKKEASWPFS